MTKDEFKQKHASELNTPVTMGVLLEYTDQFLIPAMSEIIKGESGTIKTEIKTEMKAEMAKLEHNLKSYIDDKLANYTSDIFKRLERTFQRDKAFKEKLVDVLKKNKIGTAEEIAFLEGVVFQG